MGRQVHAAGSRNRAGVLETRPVDARVHSRRTGRSRSPTGATAAGLARLRRPELLSDRVPEDGIGRRSRGIGVGGRSMRCIWRRRRRVIRRPVTAGPRLSMLPMLLVPGPARVGGVRAGSPGRGVQPGAGRCDPARGVGQELGSVVDGSTVDGSYGGCSPVRRHTDGRGDGAPGSVAGSTAGRLRRPAGRWFRWRHRGRTRSVRCGRSTTTCCVWPVSPEVCS